jgi:carbon-monoxide dehydrogenase medium subunit
LNNGSTMKLVAAAGLIPSSFRTLPPFGLVRAATVAEAVRALADSKDPAVLSGGTDLPARFNEGFTPTDLIDLSRIAELRQVTLAAESLEIGATVTHAGGSAHPLVLKHLPSLAHAWSRIANVRIRFSATLGGNLMARRTRYEGAILLSALGARLRFATADGTSEFPVEAIWTPHIPSAALLTSIVIPLRDALTLDYARELRPIMTQAVALDATGAGRIVTATEHAVPCVRPLKASVAHGELELADPVTSTAYLRRVSDVLLGRQLERMRTP